VKYRDTFYKACEMANRTHLHRTVIVPSSANLSSKSCANSSLPKSPKNARKICLKSKRVLRHALDVLDYLSQQVFGFLIKKTA
jgi:hypothetical protein